jgi:hypothetical protein
VAAAWVTRTDLPTGLPGGEVEQDAAAALASAVLYGLSGRRWAGRDTRTIEIYAEGSPWWWARGSAGWDTTWGTCNAPHPAVLDGEVFNHSGCDRPRAIRLPDYPVRAVAEVTVEGAVRDPATYRLFDARFLEDTWAGGWAVCGRDRPMTVTYEYGAEPPAAGKAAAARLAAELAKATAGQTSALPGYITQRVRQGETISYVSAATLFDKGRTGLADVDLWLATVNPGGLRRRPAVWSPDTDPRYRTTGGTTP